jgi:hypothetical protein
LEVKISFSGISSKMTPVKMFSGRYLVLSRIIFNNFELLKSQTTISYESKFWETLTLSTPKEIR